MDDASDRFMVDTSLMPLLTSRVGARTAANLLDDLAHGITGADRRLMAVLGGSDDRRTTFQKGLILDYVACLGPGVSWTGLHLIVKGVFPETVTLALTGGPLKALVDHPDLDDTLIIDHVFEEPKETYFGTSFKTCPPISIRQAMGQEAKRMTKIARRLRTLRRRINLAHQLRTPLHAPASVALAAMLALFVLTMSGIVFDSTDARIMITVFTIVTCITLGRIVWRGSILDGEREKHLKSHYMQLAFATRVRLDNSHDVTKHFAKLTRTLTG